MEREAKAKVVASIWGAEFIQFFALQAVFASVDLEEKVEFILFFENDRGKIGVSILLLCSKVYMMFEGGGRSKRSTRSEWPPAARQVNSHI